MTTSHTGLPRRWPWRRLVPAIGLSLLVHVLVADNWRSSGSARQSGSVALLQARLEAAAPPALPVADRPDFPLEPERAGPAAGAPALLPQVTPAAPASAGTLSPEGAGATAPDPRFYQARELDLYPAPLTPLKLQAAAGVPGILRLWVSIDSAGNVLDVTAADAGSSGALEHMARELLQVTRFMPAVKNGRPVKSRVLLELRYGP